MSVEQLVQAELARAVAKFPTWPTDPLHALAVLGEEFGELTKAMLQHTYEPHKGVTAQDIRDGDVQDEAIKLLDVVQNPTDTAGAVRGLMFVNFIGGSIASAVVNLTQPLTMTLPYLSQFGGGVKAARRLTAAGKMAASGRVDDLALRVALKRAETDGIVSPQEIHHLQAQAM